MTVLEIVRGHHHLERGAVLEKVGGKVEKNWRSQTETWLYLRVVHRYGGGAPHDLSQILVAHGSTLLTPARWACHATTPVHWSRVTAAAILSVPPSLSILAITVGGHRNMTSRHTLISQPPTQPLTPRLKRCLTSIVT